MKNLCKLSQTSRSSDVTSDDDHSNMKSLCELSKTSDIEKEKNSKAIVLYDDKKDIDNITLEELLSKTSDSL